MATLISTTGASSLHLLLDGTLWDGGLTAQLTITNAGAVPLADWSLSFESDVWINADWGISVSVTTLANGQYGYTLTGNDWGSAIAVGGSVTVGFTATRSAAAASGALRASDLFVAQPKLSTLSSLPPTSTPPSTPPPAPSTTPTPITVPLPTDAGVVSPRSLAVKGSGTNYAEALQKSFLFYEAQRSGNLDEATNRIDWRGDSGLRDGLDGVYFGNNTSANLQAGLKLDLSGGYHDAGDYGKFGLPLASSLTNLAWGGLQFARGYAASGQSDELLAAVKWGTDYLLKCNVLDSSGKTSFFVAQVGDADADHALWQPAETETILRPAMAVTASKPGSDVAGGSAAALAAASILFRRSGDIAYADRLLSSAVALYQFADTYRGKYSDSIPAVQAFYNSYSGYYDELANGAAWLAQAVQAQGGDGSAYFNKALTLYNTNIGGLNKGWTGNWDDSSYTTAVLLAQQSGSTAIKQQVEGWLNNWVTGGNGVQVTAGGLRWISQWGSLRYAANTAFLADVYASSVNDPNGSYTALAQQTVDYILGANPRQSSYLVGYGNNFPQQPHSREASGVGWDGFANGLPNAHINFGALVGGPTQADDFSYVDLRTDYVSNEIALDYNAGLAGAFARSVELKGGVALTDVELDALPGITIHAVAPTPTPTPTPIGGTTGRVFLVNPAAADIVGFDPSRDRLDFADVSVHNLIIAKTESGEVAIVNPWASTPEFQVLRGISYRNLAMANFGVVQNEHLRQDIGGVLSWEQGIGPRDGSTLYVRSHEYGVRQRIEGFNTATMKLSFLYLGTRERLSVTDTAEGLLISVLPTNQSMLLMGVTKAQLVPANIEFHHVQIVEDQLEVPFGHPAEHLTLVSRTSLLTPTAPAGQVTDGHQTSMGQTQPGGHDHGKMPMPTPTTTPTPAPVNLGTASFAISGRPAVGQTLTAVQSFTDPNGQGSGGYSYQWQASGDGGLSWSPLGATAPTLLLSPALEGQTVRLKVVYTDAANFAETVFTAAQSVAYVNDGQARFSLTGTGAVGQPITASETQADPDGDGTFAYQWQAQASAGGAWQAITGANSTSFVPASAQQGQSLRLQVNYQDRQGFAETVYSGSLTVPAAPTSTPVQPIFDPGGALKPAVPSPSSPFLKVGVAGSIWYQGITAQITVTNTGTTALGSWSLTFDTTHQLSGAPWGASLSQVNLGGGLYRSTLSGKDWAASLAAGASVSVGFNATQGLRLGDAGTLTGPALFSTSAAQLAATTGNPSYQTGDTAANLIKAGSGVDLLTGLAGSDVFRITSLGQSLLGAFDRITDFSIGADSLDGPSAVAAAEVAKLGSLTALSEAGLATVLTTTSFLADKAATFTFGSGSTTRTFVALNDAVAGFQATGDALIEITGYVGDLRGLAVI
jgi:hypothetical protein